MVSSIYQAVKKENKEALFGISPQGNIDSNYSGQYADVKTWASNQATAIILFLRFITDLKMKAVPLKKR